MTNFHRQILRDWYASGYPMLKQFLELNRGKYPDKAHNKTIEILLAMIELEDQNKQKTSLYAAWQTMIDRQVD